MEKPDNLTEVLPAIRVTPAVKIALRNIAQHSPSKNLTDHIRFAVELYVNAHQDTVAETAEQSTT